MRAEFKMWHGRTKQPNGQVVISIKDKPVPTIVKAIRMLERDFNFKNLGFDLAKEDAKKDFEQMQQEIKQDIKKVLDKWAGTRKS